MKTKYRLNPAKSELDRFVASSRAVPQIQVIPPLLHADDVQPGRCFGKELHTCDQSGAWPVHVATGHLRSEGQKEFVHATVRRESTKKGRAAFTQKK